ncbi:MAG: DNA-processing protein DprA [Mariprofundaceae bacterium]|nr:DNA-processing protein DprA [Mariprofundaceae bacterium]
MQSFHPVHLDIAAWPSKLVLIGDAEILNARKLVLFCSRKCPGDLILKAYDLARELREQGVTVIGGFHTPVEKECLRILLRGTQPLIICPARSIEGMRIPAAWRNPLERGRLLILSPFGEGQRRMTANLAERRNIFVATLADELLFIHAAEGSKTRAFADRCKVEGKAVRFLD